METIHRSTLRLLPISLSTLCRTRPTTPESKRLLLPISIPNILNPTPAFLTCRKCYVSAPSPVAKVGLFRGLGDKWNTMSVPDIVKAGDPVLHEPAKEVELGDIGSERIQKIIDDMVKVMRKAPGVGLAAPQLVFP